MAFRNAQQARAYVGILGASCYTRNLAVDATNDVLDITTICDTDKRFIVGQNTSSVSIDGPLDDSAASNGQWDALTDQKQATTPTPITIMPLGADGAAWLFEADETNLSTTTGAGSTIDWSMTAQTTGVTDLAGVVIENNTTITDTANGTADTGPVGGTANGAVAHLHITAFATVTSDTITIEGSTSGAFAGEETTIFTFAAATGLTSERVEVTGTVPRYLRVVDTVVGGAGSVTRTVAVSRR